MDGNGENAKKKDESRKVPLKINRYTTVLVPEEKCTPEHAQYLQKKFSSNYSGRTSLKDMY